MPAFEADRLNDSDLERSPELSRHACAAPSRRAAMRACRRGILGPRRWRRSRPARRGHLSGPARRLEESDALAHLLRRLQRPAAQPAQADHAGERRAAHGAVDLPDRDVIRARLRGHAAGARRRALRHRPEQQRLGARRAHRPAVLALSARAADRPDLRRAAPGESRLRRARRQAVHGHARRAPAGARHEDRQRGLGRRCSPTTRSATPPPWRRWS